ncbi:hypothetical protein [Kribbella sp. NPDC003557]|uniref:hypothetical protein n=1 Tax=Kribbella sp. NPDC003557 TaxID=3154449 RepID=UPI0033BEABAB
MPNERTADSAPDPKPPARQVPEPTMPAAVPTSVPRSALKSIPNWPKVTIKLFDDHNAEVKLAGRSHPINHHDPRQAAIVFVSERAAQLGRPVRVTAFEPDGSSWPLIIHPDGQVEAVEEVRSAQATRRRRWPWARDAEVE